MSQIERRSLPVKNLELRQRGGRAVLAGTAIVFDQWSLDLGGFVERVAPSFVDRTLDKVRRGVHRLLALWNHSSSQPIGNTSPKGGLSVRKRAHGLDFELPASNLTDAQRAAIERGDISSCSFAFQVSKDEWEKGAPGEPDRRTLVDGEIIELSFCTFAAYPQTNVALAKRSHDRWQLRRSRPRRSPAWYRRAVEAMEADVEPRLRPRRSRPVSKPRPHLAPAADDRVTLCGRQLATVMKEHRVEATKTAVHEGAHVVVMLYEGVNVQSARLLWRKKWGKYTPAGGDVTTRGRSSSVTAASYIVGMIAEDRRGIGWNPAAASRSDLTAVRRLTPRGFDEWHAKEKARRVLKTYHRAFVDISNRLLHDGELSGSTCAAIFNAERARLERLGRAVA